VITQCWAQYPSDRPELGLVITELKKIEPDLELLQIVYEVYDQDLCLISRLKSPKPEESPVMDDWLLNPFLLGAQQPKLNLDAIDMSQTNPFSSELHGDQPDPIRPVAHSPRRIKKAEDETQADGSESKKGKKRKSQKRTIENPEELRRSKTGTIDKLEALKLKRASTCDTQISNSKRGF